MAIGKGLNIQKSEKLIVFCDSVTWDFAGDDFTKNGGHDRMIRLALAAGDFQNFKRNDACGNLDFRDVTDGLTE